MDFGDLQAFAVIARLNSFSRAAKQMRIAQSALSRRVKRLECGIGMTLLERNSRGAKPTEAGKFLLRRVEFLEGELKLIRHDLAALQNNPVGEIRFLLPRGVIQFMASTIVERYRRRCPNVKLCIMEGRTANNYDAVINGGVDAAMVYGNATFPNVTVRPLYAESLLIVGPVEPDRDFAGIRNMAAFPAPELSKLPLILPNRPDPIRLAVEDVAAQLGLLLNIAFEADGLSTLKTLVQAGMGYTVLSNGPAHLEITGRSLAAAPIADPTMEFTIGLIHRTDRSDFRPLIELTETVKEIVRDFGRTRYWRPLGNSAAPAPEDLHHSPGVEDAATAKHPMLEHQI